MYIRAKLLVCKKDGGMQRESMNNLSQKKLDIVQVRFERISVRVMSNSTSSVKFYMDVIEEVIVERKKLK